MDARGKPYRATLAIRDMDGFPCPWLAMALSRSDEIVAVGLDREMEDHYAHLARASRYRPLLVKIPRPAILVIRVSGRIRRLSPVVLLCGTARHIEHCRRCSLRGSTRAKPHRLAASGHLWSFVGLEMPGHAISALN